MPILEIVILFLVVIIMLLALALYYHAKKTTFISDKEKDYLRFVIDIFKEYADDLGIQSKEEHEKLVEQLEKIKNKHLKL